MPDKLEETIKVLLEGYKDPMNINLKDAIIEALNNLGVSTQEVLMYEMTGERYENDDAADWRTDFHNNMKELDKEMEEMRSEMHGIDEEFSDTLQTLDSRSRRSFMAMLIGSVILIALIFGLIITSIDSSDEDTTTHPSITETAPIQDGDKL